MNPAIQTAPTPDTAPRDMPHVLAVDDDPSIRQMVTDYLGDHDIRVTAVASGPEMDQVLAHASIDLLLLDLRLPGEGGMQIAQRLRATSDLPIIILTGLQDEADRVMGLELGADDYLTKPFSPRELLARTRALLRRARMRETMTSELARIRSYRFEGWEMNVRLRRLKAPGGADVALSNSECNLLIAFLSAPQRVLSRDTLLDLSRLHNAEVYDRSIDVQVGRLRRKLAAHGGAALIHTERGAGYLFAASVQVVRL
ncbi:MAG: response regulator [Rhodoferax sp.]|nr:response regulator [Rhodoferax sp.]MCB2040393.1 response regulator [Rhodoferax sp.]MCP5260186.1 response regulator [Rhodoferax sp.]